jgi:hypothetical protein
MGSDQVLALVETDQAAIARAQQALGDLQVIGLILCHRRWTVELAERYQSDIQDIDAGLAVTRRWTALLRRRSTRRA